MGGVQERFLIANPIETGSYKAIIKDFDPSEDCLYFGDNVTTNNLALINTSVNDGEATLRYITLKDGEVVYVDVTLSNLSEEEDKNLMSSSGVEKILCSQTTSLNQNLFSTISGKVTFEDPSIWNENLKIRITPDVEQVDGEWGGVVCTINQDGSFGDDCELHGNIENYTDNHTYQVVIFEDTDGDYRYDSGEPKILGTNSDLSLSDVKNITVPQITAKTLTFNSSSQVEADDNIPETFVLETSSSSYSVYINNFDTKNDKLKFPNGADINSIAVVNTSSNDGEVELVYNFLNDNDEVVTIKAVLTGLESEEDKELMSAEGVESILAE